MRVLGDGQLGDLGAEQGEFRLDAAAAPRRILPRHASDQVEQRSIATPGPKGFLGGFDSATKNARVRGNLTDASISASGPGADARRSEHLLGMEVRILAPVRILAQVVPDFCLGRKQP